MNQASLSKSSCMREIPMASAARIRKSLPGRPFSALEYAAWVMPIRLAKSLCRILRCWRHDLSIFIPFLTARSTTSCGIADGFSKAMEKSLYGIIAYSGFPSLKINCGSAVSMFIAFFNLLNFDNGEFVGKNNPITANPKAIFWTTFKFFNIGRNVWEIRQLFCRIRDSYSVGNWEYCQLFKSFWEPFDFLHVEYYNHRGAFGSGGFA